MATASTNFTSASGDARIDALLSGAGWNTGASGVLTYSLHTHLFGFRGSISAANADRIDAALRAWSDVADIEFVLDGGVQSYPFLRSPADIAVLNSGTIAAQIDAEAFAFLPFTSVNPGDLGDLLGRTLTLTTYPNAQGDVFLDNESMSDLAPGRFGFSVLVHELGHSLGLDHPDEPLSLGGTFEQNGLGDFANGRYTIMANFDDHPSGFARSTETGWHLTPMPFDILAIQHMYGPNLNHNTGNDIYMLADDETAWTIWDARGVDRIDGSAITTPLDINLQGGEYIQVGPLSVTAIAFNVRMEQATGGDGDDTLTGNDAVNRLLGGPGDDLIRGMAARDFLAGQDGEDELHGGDGLDSLYGNADNDKLHGDASRDFLAGGTGHDEMYGGNGNDRMYANSGRDYLDGGPGDDFMAGGLDDDIYIVDSAGDTLFEGAFTGYDTVRASVDFRLPEGFERLELLPDTASRATGSLGDNYIEGNDSNNILIGLAGNDALYGLRGVDRLFGNHGDDYLSGGLGADLLFGGVGDDVLVWDAADQSVDGNSGNDTLLLAGSGLFLDLSAVAGTQLNNIENIDLTGTGNNAVELVAADLLDLSGTTALYRIEGNTGDTVTASGGGIIADGGPAVNLDGQLYTSYTVGANTLLIDEDITQNIS